MKLTTAAEMRTIDRVTSERFGVHSLGLMENAGSAVANVARELYPAANRVTIICGKGNNGGDGFVAARKLHQAGKVVEVLLLADPHELKGDAANMFNRLPIRPVVIRSERDLENELSRSLANADIIIDAVLGTGFRAPVTGLVAHAIEALNHPGIPVLSVDIPSGADADSLVVQTGAAIARSDAIVTFTAPRPAHLLGALTRGPIYVAQIGSPDEAVISSLNLLAITALGVAPLLAPRPLDANKGRFGHALIIGGSIGKAGAAAMAGMGALRSGAGLTTIGTTRSVLSTVASFAPELMTEPLAETEAGTISLSALEYERLEKISKGKNVLAIGPGISRDADTAHFVCTAVSKTKLPTVIDADGLNAFEGNLTQLSGRSHPLVLTPHPGEMARLTGLTTEKIQRDRIGVARRCAAERQAIVVLKGWRTIVALPSGQAWINPTGNPGMATGGTGDVLTGMIAGFIAQFPSEIPSAVRAAVFLHGMSGDIAREELGEQALIATDLLKYLPHAMHRARQWAEQKPLLRIA
ncbi:MAG TPA: NAD(P)H-hydrate dehydratase [Clostridia bacterium]|nr:NAD(P)H-hydrate dehydratase [Clostridia bacterium]